MIKIKKLKHKQHNTFFIISILRQLKTAWHQQLTQFAFFCTVSIIRIDLTIEFKFPSNSSKQDCFMVPNHVKHALFHFI